MSYIIHTDIFEKEDEKPLIWITEEGALVIDFNTEKRDESKIAIWIDDADVFLDKLAKLIKKDESDWFTHIPKLSWRRKRNRGDPMHGIELAGVK